MTTSLILNRGGTVNFTTTFRDANRNVTQPAAASVVIDYPTPAGTMATTTVAMTAPTSPAVAWTAQWDTRGVGTGLVYYSIHSAGPPPCAVCDGQFTLAANPANLTTF